MAPDAVPVALPPLTPGAVLTQVRPDLPLAVMLILAAGLYLFGVGVLRARGDHWSVGRTVLFLFLGLGAIAFATMSGLAAYDDVLLSAHMVQHMLLGMAAPIFLALGAPVTLALRTLPHRARRRLLAVVHSRVVRVLTFPLVAYAFFVVTPFVLYFTALYRLSLGNDWLHELVHIHFVLVGCLFFWPLVGLDPLPGRWPYPGRALLMLLSTPFHALLGITIMQSSELLGGDWYPSLHLSWVDPKADQVTAGGVLWSAGELVSITMLAVLVAQWMRHADREARRVDRQLDRERAARRVTAPIPAGALGVADTDDGWEAPWWEQPRGLGPRVPSGRGGVPASPAPDPGVAGRSPAAPVRSAGSDEREP